MRQERHSASGRPAEDRIPLGWVVGAAAVGALIAASLVTSQIYFSMIDHGHDWWRVIAWQLACWLYWAAVSPPLLRGGAALQRPEGRARRWRLLGLAAGLTAAHILLSAFVVVLLQPYIPVVRISPAGGIERALTSWLQVDPLICGLLIAVGYGLGGWSEARRAELRKSRLQEELAKAQLAALRLEIQPHFLFNTLNSIAAQVRKGHNDEALEMLVALSELLRSTLERSAQPEVPLREEIGFLRRYLDLQKVRFADRLEVGYDLAPDCLDRPVPFLLLQPLVENVIRHALGSRPGPTRIDVAAAASEGRLVLSVSDDGNGLPPGFRLDADGGVGLSNLRSRLAQLYGSDARLELLQRGRGGAEARVEIPLRTVETASPGVSP